MSDTGKIKITFCATGNDDINAVAAKIGKDKYFVKYVIARLYNPKKGKVFEA